jgi:hypothetical protein
VLETLRRDDALKLSLSQEGATVAGRLTNPDASANCTFTGTATNRGIALTAAECRVDFYSALHCSYAERDMRLETFRLEASIQESRASGTTLEHWNVFSPGTTTSLGTLDISGTFKATKIAAH